VSLSEYLLDSRSDVLWIRKSALWWWQGTGNNSVSRSSEPLFDMVHSHARIDPESLEGRDDGNGVSAKIYPELASLCIQ
jgi:hypothetical protein